MNNASPGSISACFRLIGRLAGAEHPRCVEKLFRGAPDDHDLRAALESRSRDAESDARTTADDDDLLTRERRHVQSTTGKLTNFFGDGIDIAVRYGGGKYPGLTSEFLTDEEVFPVCSPRLLKGPHALRRPEDLKHHTLIRDKGVASFYVVYPPEAIRQRKVRIFRDWLFSEIGAAAR